MPDSPPHLSQDDCPFCEIVAHDHGLQVERFAFAQDCVVIEPLNPVTPGHRLVIPETHVEDATTNPKVTGAAMEVAAALAAEVGDCNLITSVGRYATQTVFHLHIHVVPRRPDDGLALPWTSALEREVSSDG